MLKLKRSKKLRILLSSLLVLILVSFTFGSVLAKSITGNNIVVESGETIEETSFISGNNIQIDGDVNGTTFVAANDIVVNGTINGDLFVAGRDIIINGVVKGSVFTASQKITVKGEVENNLYLAGAMLGIESQTNGSAFLAGETISVEDGAIIEKDAFIGGASIYQDGVINRDVSSASETLSVGGKIGGDLSYNSPDKASFTNDSEISGNVDWSKTKTKYRPLEGLSSILTILGVIFTILSSLVVWVIVRLVRPTFWVNLAERILTIPLKTFGFGVLTLIFVPIVSLILMLTVIGAPLSFISVALYVISIYISKIILSTFIGVWFQRRFNWSSGQAFLLFLLGLISISILGVVPILGWIIRFVVVAFGLGSIVLSLRK